MKEVRERESKGIVGIKKKKLFFHQQQQQLQQHAPRTSLMPIAAAGLPSRERTRAGKKTSAHARKREREREEGDGQKKRWLCASSFFSPCRLCSPLHFFFFP